MKVKILDILNAKPVFEKIVKVELPFRTIRELAKVIKAVSEELTLVETKRVELVKKYGVADEKNNIKVPQESMEAFSAEMNEIRSTEIDFVDGLNEKSLESPNLTLNTQDYYLIEKFITK